MKRIVQAIFLIASALALAFVLYFLIQGRSGAAAAARPVATRQIQPETVSSKGSEGASSGEAPAVVNHIPAMPNEVILDVANFDIDGEEGDEQILTVRKTDRSDGRLSVVIADYIEAKRSWTRSWEGDTLATKLTTFSIQAKDLIGDRSLDIVCTGMNDEGAQTISVFRRKPGPSLSYVEVLSLAADSIVLGESERPESYQLGQTAGESWPVFAYTRDKDSQNILDRIKEKYVWDARKGQFAKAGSERIPGAQIERETVSKILTGSEKDFESFLRGVWYEAGKAPFDQRTKLIQFDKGSGSIAFSRADSQEVFRWAESQSTHYGVYVRCRNDSVDELVRLMDIALTGSDLVSIRVFDDMQMKSDPDDRWDGSYRRLPRDVPPPAVAPAPAAVAASTPGTSPKDGDAAQAVPAAAPSTGLTKPGLKLDGPYRSPSGLEINFASPRYSLKTISSSESGSFALYSLGGNLALDLVGTRSDGLPSARKTYKASYAETKAGKDLVRSLRLSPAKAAIDGLELLQEDDIILEQRVKG
jgi:hypothetical protein